MPEISAEILKHVTIVKFSSKGAWPPQFKFQGLVSYKLKCSSKNAFHIYKKFVICYSLQANRLLYMQIKCPTHKGMRASSQTPIFVFTVILKIIDKFIQHNFRPRHYLMLVAKLWMAYKITERIVTSQSNLASREQLRWRRVMDLMALNGLWLCFGFGPG